MAGPLDDLGDLTTMPDDKLAAIASQLAGPSYSESDASWWNQAVAPVTDRYRELMPPDPAASQEINAIAQTISQNSRPATGMYSFDRYGNVVGYAKGGRSRVQRPPLGALWRAGALAAVRSELARRGLLLSPLAQAGGSR